MKFRFIGTYTNGRTSIDACGIRFVGHEPTEVDGKEAIRRLSGSVEFEVVNSDEQMVREYVDEYEQPKRRGRKPKAAQ